jgi:pyruvate kinase
VLALIFLDISELEPIRERSLKKVSSEPIINIRNKIIVCEVIKEGIIDLDNYLIIHDKNPNVDSTRIGPKDIIDISKLLNLDINIFSCMVDNAEHIKEIKDLFTDEGRQSVKIFAKIENERAIIHFDSILANCDGIILKLNSFFTRIPKDEVRLAITRRFV